MVRSLVCMGKESDKMTNISAMKDMIFHRKSCRSHASRPVEDALLEEIRAFIAQLKPLYPDIRVQAEIVSTGSARWIQKWKTPHALAIYSQETEGWWENIGFMFQQLDLFMQAKGLGVCWVGLGWPGADKDIEDQERPLREDGMRFGIYLVFGHRENDDFRQDVSEFKRRELHDIADVPDKRLEYVRLAPSATNSQPWYFVHQEDVLHAYCILHGPLKKRTLGNMNKIDMGIALAHLYVSNHETFRFFRAENPPKVEGHYYMGSVTI